MGKKRRLMSAKAKFNSKHANHPRMRYLNSQEEVVEETSPEVVLQEEVVEKIVTGRLDKFFKDICLLEQPFVKDPDKSVELMLNELVGTIGEKISIRRFARFALGEGMEKRSEDFAAEVAKAASGA